MSELAEASAIITEPDALSWSEVADRGHLCPASPGYDLPHRPDETTGTCAECGASLEPEPGDVITITVVLTEAQADALVSLVEYGIDEREYDLDENHPYTDEEEADVRSEIATAQTAVTAINAALAAEQEK